MRIAELEIKNFRSIKYAKVYLNKIVAIVGENNAGKTSILRAINSILNYSDEQPSFENKAHQFAPKSNTHIIMALIDIPDIEPFKSLRIDGRIILHLLYRYSSKRKEIHYIDASNNRRPLPDGFMEILADKLAFILIPAIRGDNEFEWQGSTMFSTLVENSYSNFVTRDTTRVHIKNTTNTIKRTVLSRIQRDMGMLYLQNFDASFKLDFMETLDCRVLLPYIVAQLVEKDRSFSLKDCGSGTISLAIIALYRANAILNKKDTILAIEEPETHLHPQAQKRFIIALKGQLDDKETQVIFTTHSPVIIDELDQSDIVLVRKDTMAENITSKVTQLPSNFWTKYTLDENKYSKFFHYKNSDFFFAKYVVLAEGTTDCEVIKRLIEPKIGPVIADVSILNVDGVESMKYPYCLLKELDMAYSMVVDKDFFMPYLHDKIENSRDERSGLSIYRNELKGDNLILNTIFSNASIKSQLLTSLQNGLHASFDFLKKYGIHPMNYNLETDLICSEKAREEYYQILYIVDNDKKNMQYLLTSKFKAIKDRGNILRVLRRIPDRSYPKSYLKIRQELVNRILETQ